MRGSVKDGRSTVGINDLAFDKKVPEKCLNEKSDFAVQVAFDLWGGSNDGNSSSVA